MQLVEVLIRLAVLITALGVVLVLVVGFGALSYASEATGLARTLAGTFLLSAGIAAIHVFVAIWAIKGLQRGRPTIRLLLTALPLLDLVDVALDGADTALALALHVGVAALLWLPEASQQHFATASRTPNFEPRLTPSLVTASFNLLLWCRPGRGIFLH